MFILESSSVVVRYFRQGKYWNSLAFRINSKFYFRLKWVFRYVSSKKLQDTFLLKTFYLDTESCHRPQSLRKQKKTNIVMSYTSLGSLQNHDQLLTVGVLLKKSACPQTLEMKIIKTWYWCTSVETLLEV